MGNPDWNKGYKDEHDNNPNRDRPQDYPRREEYDKGVRQAVYEKSQGPQKPNQ
jgi:hypothetical protein